MFIIYPMQWSFLLSLALFPPPVASCATVYAEYGVGGRAKSVVETTYDYSLTSGGQQGSVDTLAPQTILFSRSGDSAILQLHIEHLSRSSGYSIIYHDSSGRIVNERFYTSFRLNDSSPAFTQQKRICRYSPDCLLLEEEYSTKNPYHSVPSPIIYSYDSNGLLTKIIAKNHHDTTTITVVRHEYTPSGGHIERFHMRARNGREYRSSRAYNTAGNLLEEIVPGESAQGPIDTAMRTTYGYDNNGNLVFSEEYISGRRNTTTRTEYIYDDRGSWIERRISEGASNMEYRLKEVRKRQIEYYSE